MAVSKAGRGQVRRAARVGLAGLQVLPGQAHASCFGQVRRAARVAGLQVLPGQAARLVLWPGQARCPCSRL